MSNVKWLFFVVGIVALGGCNPTDAKDLKQDAEKVRQNAAVFTNTARRSLRNGQLALRVNAALADRKGVDMSGLHIESENGIVTVGGHVRDAAEKKRVIDTVNGVRGVERVVDDLRIEKK